MFRRENKSGCAESDKPMDYHKIGLGYLPEERGLYPKKLIIDQLVYFAELKGVGAKKKRSGWWITG